MTNDCKTCPVSTGTHKPAEAVHQIDEPALEALRERMQFTHARLGHAERFVEAPAAVVAEVIKLADRQHARIAELESQLEAIGAGGVEPLRKPVQQAVWPAFYTVIGVSGRALPQYSAGTEQGVIRNVLDVARNQGYKGGGISRLIELGWEVRPVYTHPTPQELEQEQDAARYRWLRAGNAYHPEECGVTGGVGLDEICDEGLALAAQAKQGGAA